MTTRAVAEMREWDRRQYDGGFDGLHDLADQEFTGAVEADSSVLYMLSGRVVGVFELDADAEVGEAEDEAEAELQPADIERFEDATGTAYEAPHAALPLLFAMQATGGEERGRYYTEDTPLEEVHERLSGGFTGYVELSENVLSGDYYSVYHGGRAKHVAFVGQSDRLLEDDEAFERACDEVGIYTVTAVDLDIVDIPGDGTRDGAGAGASGAAGAAGAGAAGAAGAGGPSTASTDDEPADAADETPAATDDTSLDVDIPDATEASAEADTEAENEGSAEGEAGNAAAEDAAGIEDAGADDDRAAGSDETPTPDEGPADDDIEAAVRSVDAAPADEAAAEATAGDAADAGVEEAGGQETEIEETEVEGTEVDGAPESEAGPSDVDATAGADASTPAGSPDAEPASGTTAEDAAALRSALEARETEVERLEDEVERLETTLQQVRDERDDLAARVENLEERLRDLGAGGAAPETSMTPAEALAGTSLFVRYRSKSESTLDDLSEGVSRESVVGNLQLEHHTTFETAAVTIDGREFTAFLEETQEFRFVRWLVTELPFEIRETGNEKALSELYGAIPDIDRVEFDATAADEQSFDLVARNRMGEPLVAATLDDSRESMAEDEMADLVTGGSAVSEESASLAGAMAVTSAFFEPEALSTVEEATGGSLLSRDKRESYVKLSRGRGFHLCLVEDRDDSFYLSVPEL